MRTTRNCGSVKKGLWLAFGMPTMLLAPLAQAAPNIEDLPIDAAPGTVAAGTATAGTAAQGGKNSPVGGEMVTVPRAVWEKLLRDVEELKRKNGVVEDVVPNGTPAGASKTNTAPAGSGSRNYLLLPDISFILQNNGLLSSDRRDEGRNNIELEGELGIQGYVYPGVKADAFIVGVPSEGEFGLEEGYLTFLNVAKGATVNVGRKFAPFGRTGELHPHSYLYNRQLLPMRNLVAGEALVGNGVNLNYLLPTKGKLFARASLGVFSGAEGTETLLNATDPGDPFFGGVPGGTGAGFNSRFYNARLWLGHPVGKNGELELGLSHARGNSAIDDDGGNTSSGKVRLYGVDAQYRRYMGANKRLLLRSEYFKYKPGGGLLTSEADGYYGLANYRFDKYNDVGVLYENSGFPQAPGARENAASLIYTRQFTERFLMRVMGTHGKRAGDSYNELRLQFTAGLGPHTHNLE